jgi:hypothetical protein
MAQVSAENRSAGRKRMTGTSLAAGHVFVTLCFASPCESKEAHTLGVGGDSCVSYVSSRAASQDQSVGHTTPDDRQILQSTIYREWLLGFISGYNATLSNPTDRVQVDAATVEQYVHWWCGQNRASNISAAVQQFLNRADP